ncbi:MAG: TatD family hydrolase, partial [Chloroflexi bacterium]|nr:TatD family hydrolase [Chloroflexota bacterium]
LRVLREERGWEVGGAMHYFQGDERTARECLDLGFLISLARPLMRLPQLQDLARKLPLEAFVLETDSFPQPFKGKRENWTEPRHVREVAGKLAQLKGTSLDEVAQVTTANLSGVLTRKASPGRATLLGRALGLLQEQRPDS